jgi:hypothetical protein
LIGKDEEVWSCTLPFSSALKEGRERSREGTRERQRAGESGNSRVGIPEGERCSISDRQHGAVMRDRETTSRTISRDDETSGEVRSLRDSGGVRESDR